MPTISEFKAQAKRLLAYLVPHTYPSFKHTHCLEAVARAHGYRNWSTLHAALSSAAPSEKPVARPVTYLYGPVGRAKTAAARRIALADYSAGHSLAIVGHGGVWCHLMQALEGAITELQEHGSLLHKGAVLHSDTPNLLELERGLRGAPYSEGKAAAAAELSGYFQQIEVGPQATVIVDEAGVILRHPVIGPPVLAFIRQAHAAGAHVLIIAQSVSDKEGLTLPPLVLREVASNN